MVEASGRTACAQHLTPQGSHMSAQASGLGTRGAISAFQAPQGRNKRVIAEVQWPFVAPLQGFDLPLKDKPPTRPLAWADLFDASGVQDAQPRTNKFCCVPTCDESRNRLFRLGLVSFQTSGNLQTVPQSSGFTRMLR